MNKYKILIMLFLLISGVKSNADRSDLYDSSLPNESELTEEEKKQLQLNEQLKEAVKNADFQKIEEFLDQGADINFQNANGDTLLMIVASSGSLSHPRSSLIGGRYQPSTNVAISSEKWTWSSLPITNSRKQRYLLKLLLENGANINIQNKQGWTVLMMLASLEDGWAVRFITSQGAELNIQDNEGRTALMFAAFQKNVESVILLSQKGADANIKDEHDRTALTYAIETLRTFNVETLSQYTNEAEKSLALEIAKKTEKIIINSLSVSLSHQNEQFGNIRIIKETLQNSQNNPPKRVKPLNEQLEQLNEQLIEAVKNIDIKKVGQLLNQVANPNAKDENGKTVLMYAVGNERKEDSGLFTPFQEASRRQTRIDIIDKLIYYGANIEATDNEGKTAIIWAAIEGHIDIFLALRDLGTSVLTKDKKHNKTALMWAKYKKRDRTFIQALTKAEAEEKAQLKELEDSNKNSACHNTF